MSQNYSNLFSGISGNTSGNTNWYSDWASIKSGSYRKLMKAYYGNVNSSDSGTAASGTKAKTNNVLDKLLEEKKNPKVSKEVQDANARLTTGITSLKGAVSALQNKNTYTNSEDKTDAASKVVSAVKNYVSMYNDVVNSAKRSTLTNKTSHVAAMMKTSEANADKLAEIGITVNKNGTLQINESKLKAADISKVQELFSKEDAMSYGSTVMSRLGFAGISSGTTESTATDNTDQDNVADAGTASLKTDIEKLTSDSLFEKTKDKNGTYQYDISQIFASANSFVKNYNSMLDAAQFSSNSGVTANLARIMEKTAENKNALKQFGIQVDQKGRLTLDEDTFKKSDMSQVQKFFKEYGSSIATNVSLVDYYMTTQANTANSYTADGIYNVQGGIRFDGTI